MKKVALEEHFTTPLFFKYNRGTNPFQDQLLELGERRLEAMDKAGIELAVLSITTPGVQSVMFSVDYRTKIPSSPQSSSRARRSVRRLAPKSATKMLSAFST